MKKYIYMVVVLAIVLIGGTLFLKGGKSSQYGPDSFLNATYNIDGKNVTLKNGLAEEDAAPGSASKIVTRYFGNEVKHDFDGDGREDVAFILTQETGGSGVFYYVVAAINGIDSYAGSKGLLLGDRIAPQTTEMSKDKGSGNIIVVNYADRAKGESFAVKPSVGKSIWLLLDPKTREFGEVAQNFEGEANPNSMTLSMKKWTWIDTTYNDGTVISPNKGKIFTLTFNNKDTFGATTDCNGVGGNYIVSGNKITFDKMVSTLMYCEGSQEGDFTKALVQVEGYHFTSKGELVFDLKFDSGVMLFK